MTYVFGGTLNLAQLNSTGFPIMVHTGIAYFNIVAQSRIHDCFVSFSDLSLCSCFCNGLFFSSVMLLCVGFINK